ncbi:protein FAR1-RELATED SEQUENCE 5-like [Triticum urartu]|uniref:protein FAR1-RELATED SEQUENCE 5-like n=1 Tax=Triticum urartu TaxID=4572 RepID=UPI0020449E92|nr:protein FAR1-RELATED SEQUENCE 5-like [Triticum urartu]
MALRENSSSSEHVLRLSGYYNCLNQVGVNLPDKIFQEKGKGKKGNFKKNGKQVAAQVKKPKSGPKPETKCFYCKGTGHIGVKRMKKLHTDGLLEPLDYESLGTCEPCLMGKMTKTPFSGTMERATDLLKIIHTDVCGPMNVEARGGVRIRKAPAERELNPNRKSALELSMRAFILKRDGNVVNPAVRSSFDSLGEAYQFYNLYSWELGFGIRYSKSRLNVERVKCMQEIVCGCAGKPERENTRSTRCGCAARIRLLRSDDNGWYISEHRAAHNHSLSSTCGEKMHWPSHRLIDRYTKDLVRQLRENNVSLGKVFSIVGSFFRTVDNVPFTKRSLKTLCCKLNKEQSDSDARKTMDILAEMKAKDPEFNYTVQVDDENQARSMELAIETEMPNTTHRWCKWHVLKKAKESMGVLWSKKTDFKSEFHKLVHHMVTEQEFEDGWSAMLDKYSLRILCFDMFQSGVLLRVNLPIERHASKIYTRAMFEQFGDALYKAGVYELDVVVLKNIYILTHVDALAREKWSKVQFKVEVDDDQSFFNCECGIFEHSGMVCCHSLKVMIELKLSKIPDKHILKRWTRDARDILPEHLVRYQKDRGPHGFDTYRHNAMYMKALECVRLGDSNVKCYDVFMAMMKEVYTTLLPLSHDKDGMGLEEREALEQRAKDGTHGEKNADACINIVDGNALSNCSWIAPAKEMGQPGRPTTSRDKAPYEDKMKRSRFCAICRVKGHKSTTCPERGDIPKAPRKMPKCGKCGVLRHRRNSCGKRAEPFVPNFL